MYEERIWRFLKGKLLSDCGAAGLMGNLYAESGLNPVNLQNTHERKLGLSDKEYTQQVDFGLYADFVHDGAGYGLAQWTFWSRKQNLLAFAKSREKSIGDLETQLEFLWKELTESYASLAQMLMSASSVRLPPTRSCSSLNARPTRVRRPKPAGLPTGRSITTNLQERRRPP